MVRVAQNMKFGVEKYSKKEEERRREEGGGPVVRVLDS